MVDVMGTHVKYVADNSRGKGFGGLMMSAGVQKVATRAARDLAVKIPVVAAYTESLASGWSIKPGWITEAYSSMSFKPIIVTLTDAGHRNPRQSRRILFDKEHGNDNGGLVESSVVTLEFGSHYNEGTRTDRPALRVLAQALRLYIATQPGGRAAVSHTPMRGPSK